MANVVNPMPAIPRREKGAKDARFFIRQRGRRIVPVIPKRVLEREMLRGGG